MRVAALGNLGVSLLCRRGQVRAPATYTTRRRPLTAPRASPSQVNNRSADFDLAARRRLTLTVGPRQFRLKLHTPTVSN